MNTARRFIGMIMGFALILAAIVGPRVSPEFSAPGPFLVGLVGFVVLIVSLAAPID